MRKVGQVQVMPSFSAEPSGMITSLPAAVLVDYSTEALPDPLVLATPTVLAGISCDAAGTLSGLSVIGSTCGAAYNYPHFGPSYGRHGETVGATGERLDLMVVVNLESTSGINASLFPYCAFVAVYIDNTQRAYIDIPTANGYHVYHVIADGTTGEVSATEVTDTNPTNIEVTFSYSRNSAVPPGCASFTDPYTKTMTMTKVSATQYSGTVSDLPSPDNGDSHVITLTRDPDGWTFDAYMTGGCGFSSTHAISGQALLMGAWANVEGVGTGGCGCAQTIVRYSGISVHVPVPTAVPTITSPSTASGSLAGTTYQITATQMPTAFGATGLPTGLTVDTNTGLISGTVDTAGTYVFTVSATNELGTGTLQVTLTISVAAVVTVSGFDDYFAEYDWWHYSSRFNGTYVEERKASYYFDWYNYTAGWNEGGTRGVFRHTVNTTQILYYDESQGAWMIQDESYIDPYMNYASIYNQAETPPLGDWSTYYYANDGTITVS